MALSASAGWPRQEVATLEQLVSISGTKLQPVTHLAFRGLTFAKTTT